MEIRGETRALIRVWVVLAPAVSRKRVLNKVIEKLLARLFAPNKARAGTDPGIYIELPHKDPRYGDGTVIGRLKKAMYGTRDAHKYGATTCE